MFRLNNPNLPLKLKLGGKGAIARVFNADRRGMGTVARINVNANYDAATSETVDLPAPKSFGYYYRFELSSTIKSAKSSEFTLSPHPLLATQGAFWITQNAIAILSSARLSGTHRFSVSCYQVIPAPDPSGAYFFTVDSGFTAISANVEGLYLSQVSTEGSRVAITATGLTIGAEIIINGTQEFVVGEANSAIAVFDLSGITSSYPDRIDYFGVGFTPSRDAFNPLHGEFLWNPERNTATLFIEERRVRGMFSQSPINDYANAIGRINFKR
jgi:hypothetical protein